MTTIGYGDITPQNYYEASLLIVGMVGATFTFSIAFNTIGEIVKEINKEKNEFQKEISLVNIYLERKNASGEMRFYVQKYLESKF